MTYNGLQSLFKTVGEEGCFFLCYYHTAEKFLKKSIDITLALHNAISQKAICYYKWKHPNNMYINDAGRLMKILTGWEWSIRKERPDYKACDGEYVIKIYRKKGVYTDTLHAECDDFIPLDYKVENRGFVIDSLRVCYPVRQA